MFYVLLSLKYVINNYYPLHVINKNTFSTFAQLFYERLNGSNELFLALHVSPGVLRHVARQVTLGGKRFPADAAFVRPFARVRQRVFGEVALPRERFLARAALVRSLSVRHRVRG